MSSKLARFTRKVTTLAQKAVVGNAKPALRRGDGGYADWVIVSIHGLKTYLDLPYRRLLDVLHEMPRIAEILDLEVSQLPDFTTVCARMQDLKMPIWRDFLRLSAELHETGEIQAIDATGMDRIAASQHYAKRTNYTFRAVKTTALIDCETGAILDIHCPGETTTRYEDRLAATHPKPRQTERSDRRQRIRLGATSPQTPV